MRLDLFKEGDNVLLLGEGNFSFAKCLFNHNLPINLTATCFHGRIQYENELENINFLEKNNVPVYRNVDGTLLHLNKNLRKKKFSKIIFNFPHVGGKMKIHLNRELVRKICISANHLLNNGDFLVISLCNGQGGTPVDNPQRKWNDSWQVAEMAAYGNFCLLAVTPFDVNNFSLYKCVGYRSQDTHFNLKGALVHIFAKRQTPSRIINSETAFKKFSFVPLWKNSEILVPSYYAELYEKNPIDREQSGVSYLKHFLMRCLNVIFPNKNFRWKFLSDKNISVCLKNNVGVKCVVNGCHEYRLRHSPVQIFNEIVHFYKNLSNSDEIIFFPSIYFNFSLDGDFYKTPPLSIQFVLLGSCVSLVFHKFVKELSSAFERVIDNSIVHHPLDDETLQNISNVKAGKQWHDDRKTVFAHEFNIEHNNTRLEACFINIDKLMELFFFTKSWKEVWSNYDSVSGDFPPVFNCGLIYPPLYKFDITLKYDSQKKLLNEDVYEVLRVSAADLISDVELINKYHSKLGWSSKCFRITYQSFNEPLHKKKVVQLHSELIGKMLSCALSVTIK